MHYDNASHSKRVDEIQRLEKLVQDLDRKRDFDCAERLGTLYEVVTVLETLMVLYPGPAAPAVDRESLGGLAHIGCYVRALLGVRSCRRLLEDARVAAHCAASASVLDGDSGLTEDVCYFMAVALCDHFLLRAGAVTEHTPSLRSLCSELTIDWPTAEAAACFATGTGAATHPYYIWPGVPCSRLTATELEDAFAALFQHAREVCWDPGVPQSSALWHLIGALHLQSGQLLVAQAYPVLGAAGSVLGAAGFGAACSEARRLLYCGHRASWSCAVARLNIYGLQTLQWTRHRNARLQLAAQPEPVRTSYSQLGRYLAEAVDSWNGPRLREALSKANGRRLLRPDEVGRTAAFEGSNTYCRARGCTDGVEEAMHAMDLPTLLRTPPERRAGALCQIRELLVLKLMHNALEATGCCDFMGRHVRLQSLRDAADLDPDKIDVYVHRLWELPGGWVAVPHQKWFPVLGPLPLDEALCFWYDAHFGPSDPLRLRDVNI